MLASPGAESCAASGLVSRFLGRGWILFSFFFFLQNLIGCSEVPVWGASVLFMSASLMGRLGLRGGFC